MKICGIDEAGRGPVIGPMVMSGVVIEEHEDDDLRKIGVKDSKLLSPAQRNKMFHSIKQQYKHYIISVPPQEIDDAVIGGLNLNNLEAKASARILAELRPDKAILDCPSTNPPAYILAVRRFLPDDLKKMDIVAEHKADVNYPVVSAASILAKVTRDSAIELIKIEIGHNFGSGYPSDPLTQEFLKKHYRDYDIFRKSWSSWSSLADKEGQSSLGDF